MEDDPLSLSFKESSPVNSISDTVDFDADADANADTDSEETTQATIKTEPAPEDEDMSATGNMKEEPSADDAGDEDYTGGMFMQEI